MKIYWLYKNGNDDEYDNEGFFIYERDHNTKLERLVYSSSRRPTFSDESWSNWDHETIEEERKAETGWEISEHQIPLEDLIFLEGI